MHCILHTHTQTSHTPGANVSLMHGHAVARGLNGYINTNIPREGRKGKKVYFMLLPIVRNSRLELKQEAHHLLSMMKNDRAAFPRAQQLDALI